MKVSFVDGFVEIESEKLGVMGELIVEEVKEVVPEEELLVDVLKVVESEELILMEGSLFARVVEMIAPTEDPFVELFGAPVTTVELLVEDEFSNEEDEDKEEDITEDSTAGGSVFEYLSTVFTLDEIKSN